MQTILRELIVEVIRNLIRDLDLFLIEESSAKRWKLCKAIEEYTSVALEHLHGENITDKDFTQFLEILFECQELDAYEMPEGWHLPEEKIRGWITFLQQYQADSK